MASHPEASRRLGVAVSAPYAHFADRDALLAAVAVRAFELFHAALVPEMDQFTEPADRLAAMARGYVRFAAERTARATLALVESRRLLGRPRSGPFQKAKGSRG